jgi:hypothetical protein
MSDCEVCGEPSDELSPAVILIGVGRYRQVQACPLCIADIKAEQALRGREGAT